MAVIKQNSYLSFNPPAPILPTMILRSSHLFKWLYICTEDVHFYEELEVNKEWICLESLELL